MSDHPLDVLLVEDNPADALLLKTHLGNSGRDYTVHGVQSGEEALSFLYRGVEFTDAPRPDIVLLDLNLPEMSGFEVLAAIKQHEHLQDIPVIVLTGSTEEKHIQQAYELKASCYLTKPREPEDYTELDETILKFCDV